MSKKTTHQLNKLFLITLIVLLILQSYPIQKRTLADDFDEWIIDGDTVYVNTTDVYASATPHTIHGSDDIIFEFESKTYTGNVDFIWGFNQTEMMPTKIWLWQNYSHPSFYYTTNETYGCTILNNVTSYEFLNIENYSNYSVYMGTPNNTYLVNITIKNETNYIYAISDYTVQNATRFLICGNYSQTTKIWNNQSYFDWLEWETTFTHINHNYENMTDWFATTNQPITANHRYKCKVHVSRKKWDTTPINGKYWFAFKPSSETLQEAITNNHLYALDPWYNSTWSYKKEITLNSSQVPSNLTNFPVCINITDTDLRDHAQSDGDDIVFTNGDEDTQLNHEIEYWDNTTGKLVAWVNITSLAHDADTTIYMYYGNDAAANQESVADTWDSNYVLVAHMSDADSQVSDSTSLDNDFSENGDPTYQQSGKIHYAIDMDGSDYFQRSDDSDFDFDTSDFTIECVYKKDGFSDEHYDGIFSKYQGSNIGYYFTFYDKSGVATDTIGFKAGGGTNQLIWVEDSSYFDNTWRYICGRKTSDTLYVDMNGINDYTASYNDENVDCTSDVYIGAQGGSIDGADMIMDELRVSVCERDLDWQKATYNTIWNATDGGFFTLGGELVKSGLATHIELLNLTSNWNMTWSGNSSRAGPGDPIVRYTNNSGTYNQTMAISLIVNDTERITNVSIYHSELNTSDNSNEIDANNITVWISGDNVTFHRPDCNLGYGNGVFPPGGGYIELNWSSWGEPLDNPFTYHGNGVQITSNCTIFVRLQLNITSEVQAGIYTNKSVFSGIPAPHVFASNGTFGNYSESVYFTTKATVYRTSRPILFTNETPTNGSTTTQTTFNWSVEMENLNDEPFDYIIYCRQSGHEENEARIWVNHTTDGRKYLELTDLPLGELFLVYVNATTMNSSKYSSHRYLFSTASGLFVTNPSPANNTTSISSNLQLLTINITQSEGLPFNWSIETKPNVGSNNSNGDSNGTKNCTISVSGGNVSYTWYVNATDGSTTINYTYYFSTEAILPNVTTNTSTNITTTSATINGYLSDDGGVPCLVGFEYGLNTSYGNTISPYLPELDASTQHTINGSFNGSRSVYATDIDSDGDIDVLGAAYDDDIVAWFENNGSAGFTQHNIDTNFNGAMSVYAIDLDSDGDVDVLSTAYIGDRLSWYENDGSENFTKHNISSLSNPTSVYACDVDDDGDIDLLSSRDKVGGAFYWWENNGSENFTLHGLTDGFDNAWDVYATDIDGDGDIDILGAADGNGNLNDVMWYENDGSESFTQHAIDTNFEKTRSVYATDVDGDGDIDVLATSSFKNDIAWYENNGAESFSKHIIDTNFDGAWDVYACDVNGDNNTDILGAASSDDDITWWENDGSESFTKHTINGSFDGARSVYATDINYDGSVDILGAATTADCIAWWENNQSRNSPLEFSSSLTNLSENTTYHYRAFAINGNGTSYGSDMTFTTYLNISNVTTNASTSVTFNSAVLNGFLINDGGETCTVWFEYGKTVGFGTNTSNQQANSTENFSATLSNLDPTTKYYFRAVSQNSNGTSYGLTLNFTTLTNPIPEISNESPTNNSYYIESNPTISVQINDTTGDNTTTTFYNWSDDSILGTTVLTVNGTASTTYYNLTSNTTYKWYVKSYNHDITGATNNTSAVFFFHTLNLTAPSLTIQVYNGTFLNVTWTDSDNSTQSLITYKIGTYPTNTTDGTLINESDASSPFNISSLTGDTTYFFKSWAYNATALMISKENKTINITTFPEEPSSFTASQVNDTILNLSWSKATGTDKTLILYNTTGFPDSPDNGTIAYNNTGTLTNVNGLTVNTTYYFSAWSWGSNKERLSVSYVTTSNATSTVPDEPINFQTITQSSTEIDLSWTAGNRSTKTRILRKTSSYPTGINDGTLVYFDSGTSYSDTGLNKSQQYFYRAWAYNDTTLLYSTTNASSYNWTFPQIPQNLTGIVISTDTVNITWNLSIGGDMYMVRKKSGSFPSSTTDGNLRQNSSRLFYNDTAYSEGDFYAVWAYNNTSRFFSARARVYLGRLIIYAYREDQSTVNITNFTITLTNQNGSETYYETNCNNPKIIEIGDVPQGEDISIIVSKSGFYDRIQHYDINQSLSYVINFFLAPNPEGGGTPGDDDYVPSSTSDTVLKTTDKFVANHTLNQTVALDCEPDPLVSIEAYNSSIYGHWYPIPEEKYNLTGQSIEVDESMLDNNTQTIRVTYYCSNNETYGTQFLISVVGPQGEFSSRPIENAKVTIQRYISSNDTWDTIYSLYTDANGQVNVYLIPDVLYKVFITKDNYETEIADYIPNENNQVVTFRITPTPYVPSGDLVTDYIRAWYNWSNSGTGLYMRYIDLAEESINVVVEISSYLNDTVIYRKTYDSTNRINDTNFTSANQSYPYICTFRINHSYWNYTINISGVIFPHGTWDNTTLENYLNLIFGDTPLVNPNTGESVSWLNAIFGVVGFIILISIGSFSAEAGIFGMGVWFLFVFLVITGTSILYGGGGAFCIAIALLGRLTK